MQVSQSAKNFSNQIVIPDAHELYGVTFLDHLAPILAQGPDAAQFLHSQISQDVLQLPADQYRLGGYCSVKGRLLANFPLLKLRDEELLILVDSSLLPQWLKRLQMYVMRAKVKLQDARQLPQLWQVLGIVQSEQASLMFNDRAQALSVGGTSVDENTVLIRLPDVLDQPRWIWVGPTEVAQVLLHQGQSLNKQAWEWLEVMSGIARITAHTTDQFVPQMVNYEIVGGINFQKGCYPGQEVVARSQYRGTVKRRLFLVHSDAPLQVMQEIYSPSVPDESVGLIVNTAPIPNGTGWSALAEIKLAWATPNNVLCLSSANGPSLYLDNLPYEIPLPKDS